jgi:hypothetical protein
MRKFAMTLIAAALLLGTTSLAANAQTLESGAANVHALAQNATPIVKEAACRGWGPWCRPGWVRRCRFPYRPHCRCVPCY